MRIGQTPFVPADLVDPGETGTGATVKYATGHNCSGTHHDEVLMQVTHPDGKEHVYVIIRGLSRAKTEAIAMILNAPELS